jgi:hypothetical protein
MRGKNWFASFRGNPALENRYQQFMAMSADMRRKHLQEVQKEILTTHLLSQKAPPKTSAEAYRDAIKKVVDDAVTNQQTKAQWTAAWRNAKKALTNTAFETTIRRTPRHLQEYHDRYQRHVDKFLEDTNGLSTKDRAIAWRARVATLADKLKTTSIRIDIYGHRVKDDTTSDVVLIQKVETAIPTRLIAKLPTGRLEKNSVGYENAMKTLEKAGLHEQIAIFRDRSSKFEYIDIETGGEVPKAKGTDPQRRRYKDPNAALLSSQYLKVQMETDGTSLSFNRVDMPKANILNDCYPVAFVQ